jgi:hypothetical protein
MVLKVDFKRKILRWFFVYYHPVAGTEHLRNIYCLFSVDQRGSDDDRALAS